MAAGISSQIETRIEDSLLRDWCQNGAQNETGWFSSSARVRHQNRILFVFYYPSCISGPPLPYDKALVTLYRSANQSVPCQYIKGQVEDIETMNVSTSSLDISKVNANVKILSYESQVLEDGYYYCLSVTQEDHILCQDDKFHFCHMSSHWTKIESPFFLSSYIPFCNSHVNCAWLYITVAGAFILTLSCLLAVCCVHCRCRKRNNKMRRLGGKDESIPFQGLSMNEVASQNTFVPKKTWIELHAEWDTEPPKNPGKILLLYSPDSKLFKDLQSSLKSFLEMACHCIVLDLFDEELFQSIAFDPELWLTNLLQDPDFKIIIICSEGAFKRQQSLLNGEVLNIPENSTLDGLFSAGLKFIQEQHAYDYNRLALARYEMLHLTSPEFRLQEMVPNREFLIPTQLHDLFCWIHSYDPLDLLGKPWDRYHLEWQLLTDALKQTRMERK